jgi:hypothetical protein
MAAVEELLDLLVLALRDPFRRKDSIAKFQAIVWKGLDPALPASVRDVLRDLAYDLDFFDPRPDFRSEDGALYGHGRTESEIRGALEKLRAAGVNTPTVTSTGG